MNMRRILFGLILLSLHLAAQQEEVRLLSSDASGCLIEYTPTVSKNMLKAEEQSYAYYTFARAQQKSIKEAGSPDLRFRDVLIGLPALTGNTVTIVRTEYRDEAGVALAPVPDWHRNESDSELVPVYKALRTQMQNTLLPSSPAEIVHPGVARDRMIASIRFSPVQWNPASRTARVFSRIIARVDFGAVSASFTSKKLTGDFFSENELLNYQQCKDWRIAQAPSMKKVVQQTLASGDWYRIEITEEGIYRLPKSWFDQTGIDVAKIDPRTIRVFNSGGKELPMGVDDPRADDLQEIAIEVSGESDGKFDGNDYVLFYGRGLSGFSYDKREKRYRHYTHRFDAVNSYLLTFGGGIGKRVQGKASLNETTVYKPQWFTASAFVEEDKVNFIRSGRMWVGSKISPGATVNYIEYAMKLDNLVTTQPILIRSVLFSRAANGTTNSFTIEENRSPLCTVPMGTVDLGTDRDDIAWQSPVNECSRNGNIPNNMSNVRIIYTADDPTRNEGGYVDWIEWHYARSFRSVNDALRFSGPDTTATVEYRLDGFSTSDLTLYDVSDFSNVVRITNGFVSAGTVIFQATSNTGTANQYLAVAAPAFKIPAGGKKISNSNLLGSAGAEFVIITASDFVDAAKRLKTHREKDGENKISTLVASTQEIYNEFNGGVTDPNAMRNFIRFAFTNWSVKPAYVLLLGDGHYDYVNHATKERIIVPVHETENSTNLIDSYVTDDFFVQVVGNDSRVDLAIGRLPVQNMSEANDAVDKIIRYESTQKFEPWRNTITFVADDGLTTNGDDGNTHTAQAEQLAQSVPQEIDQKKIYVVAYKTEITSQGRRKPEASRAIIDQMNAGNLIINYTGHGNESVWTHERVLISDISIPQMNNADKISFLCAATCAFGLYDMPDIRSGTEMMVLKPDGGMIGALSSPRVVYSNENSAFNLEYFRALVNNGREADGRAKRVGNATYASKQLLYGNAGYEKFHLFGDPTVRLLFPRYRSVIDEILVNDQPIASDTVQLKALSKVTFKASVRKLDNSVWTEFNGTTQVALLDAKRTVPVPEWGSWTYELPGGLLYRGQSTIKDGRYTVTFILPKDISYENNTGRISLYIENNLYDGVGYSTRLRVAGTDTTNPGNAQGPKIQLFMDSRSFHPGDLVSEHPLLIVDLYDDYGINTTGNSIGHDIEAWIDGSKNSVVLNDYYKSKIDSYREGVVQYQYRDLQPGMHSVKVRAWNIFNISATAETNFEVASSANLQVKNLANYPNPMANSTVFSFMHNLSEPVNAEIKIYTVAGRLVRRIERNNVTERFVHIPWDCHDEDGDLLGNGVYFYKLLLQTVTGEKGSEVVERLVVLR